MSSIVHPTSPKFIKRYCTLFVLIVYYAYNNFFTSNTNIFVYKGIVFSVYIPCILCTRMYKHTRVHSWKTRDWLGGCLLQRCARVTWCRLAFNSQIVVTYSFYTSECLHCVVIIDMKIKALRFHSSMNTH